MVSIPNVLERFKRDPLGVVDASLVEEICREQGHTWRRRELDPATTVALFVQQVLAGNCPCGEVPHVAGRPFTGSAYCQARARLPLGVYPELTRRAVARALPPLPPTRGQLWLGRPRTLLVDCTTARTADTAPRAGVTRSSPSGRRRCRPAAGSAAWGTGTRSSSGPSRSGARRGSPKRSTTRCRRRSRCASCGGRCGGPAAGP